MKKLDISAIITHMIGYINGRVIGIFPSGKNVVSLVIAPFAKNERGVAYSILYPLVEAQLLSENDDVSLWTYAVTSENSSYLIGFRTKAKVVFFLSLLSVSGVGPRSAMTILSVLSIDECKVALRENDSVAFSKVPGIGKKTAAKIIVELSDKDIDLNAMVSNSSRDTDKYSDITATLIKLGYSKVAAKDVIKEALPLLKKNPNMTTAEKVTLVLSSK